MVYLCYTCDHIQYSDQVLVELLCYTEEYVRMNRGINDNADLPQSFLEEVYDDILKNEIRMRDSARAVRGTVYGAGECGLLYSSVGGRRRE